MSLNNVYVSGDTFFSLAFMAENDLKSMCKDYILRGLNDLTN